MREASRRTSTPRSSLARWPFQLWLPKVSWCQLWLTVG
jgi:hypothetical protein